MGFCVGLVGYLCVAKKAAKADEVWRGTKLTDKSQLQKALDKKQDQMVSSGKAAQLPLLEIAGVKLPNYYDNLGFFAVGSPGSGKSQVISKLIHTMKERLDFRGIIFDRNGGFLESFYDPDRDLIFNPRDARSVLWSHKAEGLRAETVAGALIPDGKGDDAFFVEAGRSLLSDLYERCDTNSQVWEILSSFTIEELTDFVKGGLSHRYFISEKTGGSVLSTLINQARFYRELGEPPEFEGFSFSQWAKENDPRWLFVPLFEDDAELYQPLLTAGFEMVLRGLLSNEGRTLKTAVVIDELGALKKLRSLSRLLSESRKSLGTAILGTQTEAQITKIYGEEDTRILLQGCATKVILNCRDPETAETFAKTIGQQERIDITKSKGADSWLKRGETSESEQIREVFAVMPAELEALPSLEGYLTVAEQSPAKIKIEPRSYGKQNPRFVERI